MVLAMNMIVVWGVLAAVFLVVELITIGMVSIWFLIGALAALLSAVCGAPFWLQLLIFIAVSVICFLLVYPRLKHMIRKRGEPTNADMILGQNCRVTQRIDNISGTGSVTIGGKTWTARSADGSPVDEGTLVCIQDIQGVKVIVSPASPSDPSTR